MVVSYKMHAPTSMCTVHPTDVPSPALTSLQAYSIPSRYSELLIFDQHNITAEARTEVKLLE